jgi:threonylcarbamoyladenosine tRNA methylthiotransferase MtaB
VASFYIENFGCRATQADGAAIERQFRDRGLERATSSGKAEVVILNTCTVTASADQDARAAIRRVHRENPGCEIVVTGCYAQRAPEEVSALPGVAQVIGNSHKHQLGEIVSTSRLFRSSPHSRFVPLSSLSGGSSELTTSVQPQTPDRHSQIFVSDIFAHTELLAAPVFEGEATESARTRPNLKVQDGCDNRCSFCVIPSVRGQSRSLPLDQVLGEMNALVAAGYREVVISGINLGRWGRDFPGHASPSRLVIPRSAGDEESAVSIQPANYRSLAMLGMTKGKLRFEDLVHAILAETSLEKLRLSSVEPMDWTAELIRMMAESPRIAKHAHVPMQSGSDRVLRLMHRKYRPWHYREKIEKIRAAMPTAAIGADVMAGFPGETAADFEETRRMIEELPFTYLHVFTYSSRPGTPSAAMGEQVPVHIARERNRILRDLAAEKKLAFMRSFVGKAIEAITLTGPPNSLSSRADHCDSQSESQCGVEGPRVSSTSLTEALTDNYLKLRLQGRHDPNRWLAVQVNNVEDGMLVGSASRTS